MQRDIQRYIRKCNSCQRNKAPNRSLKGPLKPLSIPRSPWGSVSFDFITNLPSSSGFDSIFVVVDQLTKMSHFIPLLTTATAPQVAQAYFNHVFRLHGLPRNFVSDRDPKFTSAFWTSLFKLLNTRLSLSSTAHPESDGQTERVNGILEVMLRHFINANLSNWSQLLPVMEFAYNNTPQKSTGFSPFFLNYGYEPLTPVALTMPDQPDTRVESVSDFILRMRATLEQAKDAIHEAQTSQAKHANQHRSTQRKFKVGDRVLLSTKNIKTLFHSRNSNKLQPLYIGPFDIVDCINSVAFRLNLPPSLPIHNVVYIDRLRRYHAPEQPVHPRPYLTLEGTATRLYIVEKLVRRRQRHRRVEYLVKWEGYPAHESTWEPRDTLMEDVPQLVEEFDSSQ